MGIYIRKGISVGPIRFNLSKSGVGLSAGVKGLRIGTGPRGNYIHMGRGGLYYRATIPSGKAGDQNSPRKLGQQPLPIPAGTHAPLEEIESADASSIVDSSSRELLVELNRKRRTARIFPIVAIVGAGMLATSVLASWPLWSIGATALAVAAAAYAAHSKDMLSKTAVLFYDLDPEMEVAYQRLHDAASQLAACARTWHIAASGQVHDKKYHAGASHLIRRNTTSIGKTEPPYLKSNVEAIAVGVGKQTLHFFPDRVLVYEKDGVGAVGYKELQVAVKTTRFIEDGAVPTDAKVVDKTWKYVNKSGGPDRRFKDNRELPVCVYDEISLSSRSGLNEVLQLSRCGIGEELAEAISALGARLPKEGEFTRSSGAV